MTELALETGDEATWVGSLVALLAALFAIWQQRRQEKGQAEADRIAKQAAQAAERRALAVEEGLQRLLEQLPSAMAQGQIAGDPPRREAISWELDRPKKNVFVLRNEGTDPATGVRVDLDDHPAGLTRNLPEDGVVRASEAVEFMIFGSWQHPRPRQLRVWREGKSEPDVLPVPTWD